MRFQSALQQIKRRKQPRSAEQGVTRELLQGVWGLNLGTDVRCPSAYLDHCCELRRLFVEDGFAEANRKDIVEVVDVVRSNQGKTVGQLMASIKTTSPRWIASVAEDASQRNVLAFVLRLWLFIEPVLSDESASLKDVVAQALPKKNSKASGLEIQSMYSETSNLWRLPPDFSEKSLTRKGGITLEWTSYLTDHLTFAGKSRLRIFRHATAIQHFARSAKIPPYPDGFLEETERTIALLFDPAGSETSKRTARIQKRYQVDLEAAIKSVIESDRRLDLRSYPYWGERLRGVQRVYKDAQPKTVKQWWFDRRNRLNWATFWTAVVVFILTLVFGLISSITGIMQVYAAFRSTDSLP